ncbi:MAG TPA: hypothetical protein DCE39_07195, partial [Planctomycetaceae bacterium]|nr:hypothetical protein [Planctomycetaceae bacterium]
MRAGFTGCRPGRTWRLLTRTRGSNADAEPRTRNPYTFCWAGTRRTRPGHYQGVTTGVSVVTDETEHGGEAPPSSPSIEIRHLHRFFGSLRAVDDVSFTAHPGQVLGFIGPNGAGKTTTMRILATLDLPTAGDALICGESVIDKPDGVRRVLGFMPDSFGRYPNMNISEYLDFFARAYGLRGASRREAVER